MSKHRRKHKRSRKNPIPKVLRKEDIRSVCMDCKKGLGGRADAPYVSHGLCKECLAKRITKPIKNPPKNQRRRLIKMAAEIARRLYTHFKERGVPAFVFNQVPRSIRPTVKALLKYNGVRVNT